MLAAAFGPVGAACVRRASAVHTLLPRSATTAAPTALPIHPHPLPSPPLLPAASTASSSSSGGSTRCWAAPSSSPTRWGGVLGAGELMRQALAGGHGPQQCTSLGLIVGSCRGHQHAPRAPFTLPPATAAPPPLLPQDVTWHEDRWDDPESRFLAFTLHDRRGRAGQGGAAAWSQDGDGQCFDGLRTAPARLAWSACMHVSLLSGADSLVLPPWCCRGQGGGSLYAAFNAHSFEVRAQLSLCLQRMYWLARNACPVVGPALRLALRHAMPTNSQLCCALPAARRCGWACRSRPRATSGAAWWTPTWCHPRTSPPAATRVGGRGYMAVGHAAARGAGQGAAAAAGQQQHGLPACARVLPTLVLLIEFHNRTLQPSNVIHRCT